ncbi:MAG: hypothetical protein K2Y27_06795 [Xanthobacteraceae bacterium]|nr:hypothetical protein [Xanthobacteraceae bacterium]
MSIARLRCFRRPQAERDQHRGIGDQAESRIDRALEGHGAPMPGLLGTVDGTHRRTNSTALDAVSGLLRQADPRGATALAQYSVFDAFKSRSSGMRRSTAASTANPRPKSAAP